MTWDEALTEMVKKNKVTHQYFSDDEFLYIADGRIHTEEGYLLKDEFWEFRKGYAWENNWEVYIEKK